MLQSVKLDLYFDDFKSRLVFAFSASASHVTNLKIANFYQACLDEQKNGLTRSSLEASVNHQRFNRESSACGRRLENILILQWIITLDEEDKPSDINKDACNTQVGRIFLRK